MLGSALTVRPLADDSTMNNAGLPFSCAPTMNSSASAAAGTNDLTPSSRYPLGVRTAVVFRRVGSNSGCGSAMATAGLRNIVAGKLFQIGGLLIGAAPVGERGRHTAGSQNRQCQTHVAVGQRLGHQNIGHAGAVCGDAVEILGNVDRGDAQLGGLRDQIRRVGCRLVGIGSGGPQDFFGEILERFDDHLLLVVGRQVVEVFTAGFEPGRPTAQVLDPFELSGSGASRGEDRFCAVAQAPVEWITQAIFVQELLAHDRGKQRHGDINPRPSVRLQPDTGLAAASFHAGWGILRSLW